MTCASYLVLYKILSDTGLAKYGFSAEKPTFKDIKLFNGKVLIFRDITPSSFDHFLKIVSFS